jgi:RNA polymerase sigma-70 factor (ECF subfamily)
MNGETREERFERLYKTYYSQVYGYLVGRMRITPAEAQELAQDTLFSVYRHMDEITSESAYIFTTARHKALNALRTAHREPRNTAIVTAEEEAEPMSMAPSPESLAVENEEARIRAERLLAALAELPAKTQDCLALRRQGLKYRQIAEKLGLSMDSVKSRLKEGRARLRTRLGEELEGEDGDDHEN